MFLSGPVLVEHDMSSDVAAEALTEWSEYVAAQADTDSIRCGPGAPKS
jgi:hypothetical protein